MPASNVALRANHMSEIDRLERLHKLLLSLNAISAAEDSYGLLDLVVTETMRLTNAGGAAVEWVEGEDLVYVKASGMLAKFVGLRVPQAHSLSGLSVQEQSIQRCDDCNSDDRVNREMCLKAGIRSMLVVPLLFGGNVVGVLKATSERTSAFNDEQVQALQLAVGIIAAVVGRQLRIEATERDSEALSLELKASMAEREGYRQAAMLDPLTGLPNRRSFDEALEVAVFHGGDAPGTMALLFADVNGFKTINDSFGHKVGDIALCCIAEVLRKNVRDCDFVARLAGDEFVVLFRDLTEPEREVGEVCRKLTELFELPQTLTDGTHLNLSIAFGVALHDRADLTRSEWMHRADNAMYHAKQSGRFRFYGKNEPTLRIIGLEGKKR
jgi:diguanylate cyclase (GGDEF)-like protein